jgi:hypothetical protein
MGKKNKNRGGDVFKTAMFLQTYLIAFATLSVISLNLYCFLTLIIAVKSPVSQKRNIPFYLPIKPSGDCKKKPPQQLEAALLTKLKSKYFSRY